MSPRRFPVLPATFASLVAALAWALTVPAPGAAQDDVRPRALVPSVIDSTTDRAVEILRLAGIPVEHVEEVPSEAGGGRVLRQSPREGTVVSLPAAGTLWVAVTRVRIDAAVLLERARDRLVEALEPPAQGPYTMPDVVGSPLEKAREAFSELGIQLSAVHPVEASEARGIVVRQLPRAGAEVPSEGIGELWVSTGPPEQPPLTVPVVPDVVGLPLERARLAFNEVELPLDDVRFAPAEAPRGTVIDQRPRAGSPWSPDLHGEVVVSTGPQAPEDVPVPGLIERTTREAFELLTEAGLRGDIADYAESGLENDRVVDQAPAPGTPVPPGTVVGLVISLGPPAPPVDTTGGNRPPPPGPGDEPELVPVTVPDLIGLSEEAAGRVAGALGFVLRPREVDADRAEPETVVAQQPAPGEQVPQGAVIDVDVSVGAWVVPAWALPAAVVLVGLAGFLRRRRRRGPADEPAPATPPEPDAPAPAPAPPVTFRPRPGPIRQHVAVAGTGTGLITDLTVRLAPRLDGPASTWVDGMPFPPFPGGEHE